MADLTRAELIAKLEALTGPDRGIDDALMALFFVRDERHIGTTEGWEDDPSSFLPVKNRVWVDPVTDKWVSTAAHNFTSSIDAAVALVDRMLPGWQINIHCYGVSSEASLGSRSGGFPLVTGWSPSIAICIALLRALDAKEKEG